MLCMGPKPHVLKSFHDIVQKGIEELVKASGEEVLYICPDLHGRREEEGHRDRSLLSQPN